MRRPDSGNPLLRLRRGMAGALALAAASLASAPGRAAAQQPVSRPADLGVQANIVFLYYRDIPAAQRFYEDVVGLRLTVDQGYSKIYQISPTSFVGLVDETQGLHRASDAKPVTLSFVTEQVDAWYEYLVSRGVQVRGPVRDGTRQPTRGFVAIDPEGYFLEFERFLDHPQNARLLQALSRR